MKYYSILYCNRLYTILYAILYTMLHILLYILLYTRLYTLQSNIYSILYCTIPYTIYYILSYILYSICIVCILLVYSIIYDYILIICLKYVLNFRISQFCASGFILLGSTPSWPQEGGETERDPATKHKFAKMLDPMKFARSLSRIIFSISFQFCFSQMGAVALVASRAVGDP